MEDKTPITEFSLLTSILTKQGEITAQLSVITARLEALPDHEARIRLLESSMPPNLNTRVIQLENWRSKVIGLALGASMFGGIIGGVIEHLVYHT